MPDVGNLQKAKSAFNWAGLKNVNIFILFCLTTPSCWAGGKMLLVFLRSDMLFRQRARERPDKGHSDLD